MIRGPGHTIFWQENSCISALKMAIKYSFDDKMIYTVMNKEDLYT